MQRRIYNGNKIRIKLAASIECPRNWNPKTIQSRDEITARIEYIPTRGQTVVVHRGRDGELSWPGPEGYRMVLRFHHGSGETSLSMEPIQEIA